MSLLSGIQTQQETILTKSKSLLSAILFIILFSSVTHAQEKGSFVFEGQTQKLDRKNKEVVALSDVSVALFKDGEKMSLRTLNTSISTKLFLTAQAVLKCI
jgi:hypothetical protein